VKRQAQILDKVVAIVDFALHQLQRVEVVSNPERSDCLFNSRIGNFVRAAGLRAEVERCVLIELTAGLRLRTLLELLLG
jgi:hypothetical protein